MEELPSLTGRPNASFSFSQTADAAAASSQLTPMCATSKPSAALLACLQSAVIFSKLPAAMSAFGQTQLPPTAWMNGAAMN